MNTITEKQFNAAVYELQLLIRAMAFECTQSGWSFYLTDNAPESFKELKLHKDSKRVPIASYGSDTSIYGNEVNSLFRFYHDVTHLKQDKSFSQSEEYAVAQQHLLDAEAFGVSSLALRILYLDTVGQVDYYFKNGKFLDDQQGFIKTRLGVQACQTI